MDRGLLIRRPRVRFPPSPQQNTAKAGEAAETVSPALSAESAGAPYRHGTGVVPSPVVIHMSIDGRAACDGEPLDLSLPISGYPDAEPCRTCCCVAEGMRRENTGRQRKDGKRP